MSRSKKKTPVMGIAATSEKEWKRTVNRKLRHASDHVVRQMPTVDPDAAVLPVVNEVADLWDGPKDGKMRFDPKRSPRLMRK